MKLNDILTFYDKLLIVALLIVSLVFLAGPLYFYESDSETLILKVQQGNQVIKKIPLQKSYEKVITFEVEGPIGTHLIELNQGRVRVKKAPEADPLKICQQTGWIEREGPIIICVPNSLSLWLENKESDLDGMSW